MWRCWRAGTSASIWSGAARWAMSGAGTSSIRRQLFPHIPVGPRSLVDLGSGAGLPGLVLAIMGVPEVHLVESDPRKAAFLREAVRIPVLRPGSMPSASRSCPEFRADVVTARALAALPQLLEFAETFIDESTLCLFLQGGLPAKMN